MKLGYNLFSLVVVILFTNIRAFEKLTKVLKIQDNYPPQQVVVPSTTLEKLSSQWPFGVVPYLVDTETYDDVLHTRINKAIRKIESVSCILFKELVDIPEGNFTWIHFTNPEGLRPCEHTTQQGEFNEIRVVIAIECTRMRDIMHTLLHAIGFTDEVAHPQRDQFIRIVWANIQPKYRPLFRAHREILPYKLVEYDPMSIMHFHDRAFSSNGGVTIAPLVPGLVINPSGRLSQLDIMKLHMTFSHECNKRKVDDLINNCKKTFYMQLHEGEEEENGDNEENEEDNQLPSVQNDTIADVSKNNTGSAESGMTEGEESPEIKDFDQVMNGSSTLEPQTTTLADVGPNVVSD